MGNQASRIVVKVGTSTLTYASGLLNIRAIETLVKVLSDLKNMGKQIALVTSGAVGVGMGKVGRDKRPEETREKQALAAIGQCELMNFYDRLFAAYSHNIAQILMTKDVIDNAERYVLAKNTFETLFDLSIIPIVNENDSISTEQLEFGDNDTLSAYVAKLVDADLLIILSDIDGLYDKDPHKYDDATIIPVVECIDETILRCADTAGTKLGTGGMITKIQAAQIATEAGVDMVIANGKHPKVLYDIIEGKQCGTTFLRAK